MTGFSARGKEMRPPQACFRALMAFKRSIMIGDVMRNLTVTTDRMKRGAKKLMITGDPKHVRA